VTIQYGDFVDHGDSHLQGDGPCADCGGPNIVWYCDDMLWNRVVRDHGDECILCVHCFVARAESWYAIHAWHLGIAPKLTEIFDFGAATSLPGEVSTSLASACPVVPVGEDGSATSAASPTDDCDPRGLLRPLTVVR